jgi:PQQ-dependent catabolism-associated beta-propeller protein
VKLELARLGGRLRNENVMVKTLKLVFICGIVFALLQFFSACHGKRTGPLAYVSNERDGTITVIDTTSDQVISTIKVGGRLRGIHLSPDNKMVGVALSTPSNQQQGEDKIAFIDVESERVAAQYDAGTDPEQFVLNKDGTQLYIANEDVGTASVTDMKTNKIIATLVVGLEPEGVALSPDGRFVYVTSESSSTVSVIETQTNKVVKTFLVGARPREAAFSPDGSRAFVTAENGGTISVVETTGHTVIDTIRLPNTATQAMKPKGVVVSGDGQRVYVATGRGNSVAVLDASSLQLLAMIPVGQRPWGIALTPDGK